MPVLPLRNVEILTDFVRHAGIIIWLTIIALCLLLVSYSKSSLRVKFFPFKNEASRRQARLYFGSLVLVFLTIIIYWIIDAHFVDLPDPIFPFTYYILIFTMLFGVRQTLLTTVLSYILIEYYLYEPRFDINPLDHAVSTVFTIFGLIAGLYIGNKIRGYQQQLTRKADELNFLIKARDQFAAIAAHDLKSPITTIKLYIQQIQREENTKKAVKMIKQMTQTMDRESTKLTSMVDSLLDFSKLQSGKFTLAKEELNLYTLLAERTKTLQMLYPDHTFEFKSKLRHAFIFADRISIDRVISNLLSNAAKYSLTKSKVAMRLKRERKRYIIEVTDKGDGMDKDIVDYLFKPFYQVSSSKQGLGLGLYIVKALIDLHKGNIWVESKVGKGSTFFVSLPAYDRGKKERLS